MAATLDGGRGHRTQFWKYTTQGPFIPWCIKLVDWFQKRRLLNNFPIGSYVKTMSADGGNFEPRSGSLNTTLEVDHRWHVCYIGLLVSEKILKKIFP